MHKPQKGWTVCAILNPDSVVKVDYDLQNFDVIRIRISSSAKNVVKRIVKSIVKSIVKVIVKSIVKSIVKVIVKSIVKVIIKSVVKVIVNRRPSKVEVMLLHLESLERLQSPEECQSTTRAKYCQR
jgi:hypothetical protein